MACEKLARVLQLGHVHQRDVEKALVLLFALHALWQEL